MDPEEPYKILIPPARPGIFSRATGWMGTWWGHLLSSDQSKVSTGCVLAIIGYGAGLLTFILWGIWLQKEIPSNLAHLIDVLVGGGTISLGITEGSKVFSRAE